MSKFNTPTATTQRQSPIKTTDTRILTHEGHEGFKRDAKSELFLLFVTNMVGEDTFYESASDRDSRFRKLVHEVVAEDPAWVARLIPFVRNEMFMRSAPIVAAVEYGIANAGIKTASDMSSRTTTPQPQGNPALTTSRKVVASAMARADEPGEMLAYYASKYGKSFPKWLKRGVADAAVKLFNEFSALKYDGGSRAWRMGDVVDLTHATPKDDRQSALFKYLLDKRHNRTENLGYIAEKLPVVHEMLSWMALPDDAKKATILEGKLPKAVTWEVLSSYTKMDKAAWEAVIPQMGYMALLRNLRNFDEAGVSDKVAADVLAKLSDPEEVAKSKQFPFRFLSAYKNVPTERWSYAVEQAVNLSLKNIPEFRGRTLVLIDTSASMGAPVSGRSQMHLNEVAALFGCAVIKRSGGNLVLFADGNEDITKKVQEQPLLRAVQWTRTRQGHVGHSTNTFQALEKHYDGHDRVIIISDMQAHPYPGGYGGGYGYDYGYGGRGRSSASATADLLKQVPLCYSYNVAGYEASSHEQGSDGLYEFGGLNDAGFRQIALIERGRNADWPF